jgi:putative hemolysin
MKSFLILLLASAGFTPVSFAQVTAPSVAARFCVERGGAVEPVRADLVDFDNCRFDHALIEVWTLFYELNGFKTLAVNAFVHPMSHDGLTQGNPASVYCSRVGGKTRIVDAPDGQYSHCAFIDGTQIEEWTLFLGPKDELNAKLARVLGL